MRHVSLFTGGGGTLLGARLLGWTTVCGVEIDPYCRSLLFQRQRDGLLERFPIWDDVRTFDAGPWEADVVSAGWPCQDISAAGKGAGIDGERSGLWSEVARVLCDVRPRYAFLENSPVITSRGLDRVLGDLAALGFDAAWGVYGARHVGAPHRRDRWWCVARSRNAATADADGDLLRDNEQRDQKREAVSDARNALTAHNGSERTLADADSGRRQGERISQREHQQSALRAQPDGRREGRPGEGQDPALGADSYCGSSDGRSEVSRRGAQERATSCGPSWWAAEPELGRVAHGVAHRVDRLRALGNGQVPAVAALAWGELLNALDAPASRGLG